MTSETTIDPAERQYIIKKSDPAYGMLKSIAVGFDCIKPGTKVKCPKPFLNTLAVEMTISGQAVLHYENHEVESKKGTLMLMLPDLKFYDIVGNEPWRSCWFVLWGALADTFVADIDKNSCAIAISDMPGQIRFNMFEACRLILKQPQNWQWTWLQHLSCVLDYSRKSVQGQPKQTSSLVKKACDLMNENLASTLSIPKMAQLLNVSLSTLSHQFKKETGLSPGQVYKQKRIDKSKQLLANGLSVTETSIQMGFKNPYHFSKLFKNIESISPSQFKKQTEQLTLKHT